MRDSLLSLTLGELRSEVCRYFQFGRDYDNLPSREKADVDACVRRGLRQYLSPPPLPGESHGHSWTFLRPTGTVVTEAGTGTYAMPLNFGGIVGAITFQSPDDGAFRAIEVTSMTALRSRRQGENLSSGRPEIAAVDPVSASDGQPLYPTRLQLTLWPTPDAVYTLEFQYIANIEDITTRGPETPLPGGQQHGETIISSCLAIGESMTEQPNRSGLAFTTLFLQRLAASVSLDRRLQLPSNLGQNADNSDGVYRVRRTASRVTYTP